MNTNPSVGGRGKRAPYQTVHFRIPKALKLTVQELAAAYKYLATDYGDEFDPALIKAAKDSLFDAAETLKQQNVALEQQVQDLRSSALNDDFKQLASRILKQSLKLKANADEETKQKIREIIALLS